MKVLQFNMTRVSMTVLLAAALLLAACAPAATPISAPTTAPAAVAPTVIPATSGPAAVATPAPASKLISALDFHNAMRKLWEDHITWTRLYIISAAANLPDKDLAAQRLLQNQVDIGNAIKPFYGDDAGSKLTSLLKDHILGAADLLTAAQSGDKTKVAAASAKWYANADDIATFLNGANPKAWPLADLKAGMKMHLDITLQEAVDRLGGKYADDIQDYAKVHEHILGLADLLSNGIISQFPDKFDQTAMNEFPFRSAMRKLWEDHVTWTRMYIVSVAADLPDKDVTAQRLLQNQADIGDALKPFYGDDAGSKLTALLKDHILGAADLLAAAKAGDSAKVDAASKKWYANADDIAAFLSSANSQAWPLAAMKDGMKMHLDLTLAEAVARLQGKYAEDIADYDQVHEHILGLADALSTGILSQFPDKFK
ncbi:MAG TPA: hypothetical protein VFK30_13425 [Anaerolineae bacterium]|nr:hypothetical protein [Anaerolineae bacterium]